MSSFVDVFRPKVSKRKAIAFDITSIFAGSLFLALMAKISIPLGFTPIPFSMQPMAVFLLGALLGSRKGALSVLTYLAAGTCGLPVFAAGAAGFWLFGASAGFLIGFVVCAYVVGFFLECGWRCSFVKTTLAMLIGAACMYACGFAYLSCLIGMKLAFIKGVVPFLPTLAPKIVIAAALVPTGWKLLGKRN